MTDNIQRTSACQTEGSIYKIATEELSVQWMAKIGLSNTGDLPENQNIGKPVLD